MTRQLVIEYAMNCPLGLKPPRWERRKDARPQELLDAALDLFVERGYAATRLEDVARRAGVSKGTLYLYYENKEELFKAVVRASIVPAIGDAEDQLAAFNGPSCDLMRIVLLGWWDRIGTTKASGIVKLVMAEANNFPDLAAFYREEVIARGTRLIQTMLQRGVARGEFREMDVEMTTQVLVAPVLMLMLWKHSFGPCDAADIDPPRFLENLLELAIRGLHAPPGCD